MRQMCYNFQQWAWRPAEEVSMFHNIGPQEIGLILVVVLLLFGAKRLPELARSLGQGVREFRKSVKEIGDDVNDAESGPPPKSS